MSRRRPRINPLARAKEFVTKGLDPPGFVIKHVSKQIGE